VERKRKGVLSSLWRLCPVQWCVLLASVLWLGVFFLTRNDRGWMNALCTALVRPWHRFAGELASRVPFSAAEWLVALGVVLAVFFAVEMILCLVLRRGGRAFLRWLVTLFSLASLVFGLFSLWWGVYYYADGFMEAESIRRRDIAVEELQAVTAYFASLCNEYAVPVERTADGLYTTDEKALFDASATLYHPVEEIFPSLQWSDIRAKPAFFSRIMSRINFTGYFFPLTAESNINVDSPLCMVPSTIAHELAHQRGVSGEDEANFVAVVACMASDNIDYLYSGALMAYTYLGNALYTADRAAWELVYATLSDSVRADLYSNNLYWQQFEDTVTSQVSDKVYEGFLQTYGETRGLQSYGACVDLLVDYYAEGASIDR